MPFLCIIATMNEPIRSSTITVPIDTIEGQGADYLRSLSAILLFTPPMYSALRN